jgi:putative transposase
MDQFLNAGQFTEAQILKALKEMEVRPAAEVARKLGVAPATLYQWKSRYGGMTLSELKRLRELEGENARLKKMYADLSLEHEALKDVVARKL